MRSPLRAVVTLCVLCAPLLTAGCADRSVETLGGEAVLLPAAAEGPDPFTESTATPLSLTSLARSTPSTPLLPSVPSAAATDTAPAVLSGPRSASGGMPGLYGGTVRAGGCDIERQIARLTADPAKGRAFARAEGVPEASLPGYLRGLTPVTLRSDTRVTSHGYRDGRAAAFQAVLQAGTAVLVDDRGLPRVRCVCGNPLKPPLMTRGPTGTGGAGGSAWPGYRPAEVVVVTPAPRAVTSITLVDVRSHTWIARPIGQGVGRDRVIPEPAPAGSGPAGADGPTGAPGG